MIYKRIGDGDFDLWFWFDWQVVILNRARCFSYLAMLHLHNDIVSDHLILLRICKKLGL